MRPIDHRASGVIRSEDRAGWLLPRTEADVAIEVRGDISRQMRDNKRGRFIILFSVFSGSFFV